MADTEMHWWGLKGDAAQSYPAPRCLEPQATVGGRISFKNGISRGWADEYTCDLPDQMIEVSTVIKVKLTNVARASRSAALVGSARGCAFA
jgi:hypothetical protein